VKAAEARNTGEGSGADGRAGETNMAKLKTRHKFQT